MCTILPMILGLVYALSYSFGLIGINSREFTTSHWKAVLSSITIWQSLLLSSLVAVISLLISVGLAILISKIMMFRTKLLKTQNFNLFYFPLSVPPIIAAFLTFQFLGNSGMISRGLFKVGLIKNMDSFFELVNDRYYFGVIFTQIILTFPFITLLFLNIFLTTKLNELAQVASSLGANNRQIFGKIIVPNLLQKAKPNLVLIFIVLFGSYEIPLLLGRQSPMMLSVLIAQKFRKFNLADLPQAYVVTVLYIVVVLIFVGFFFRSKNAEI